LVHYYLFLILIRGLLSTAGFIFMQLTSRFITVLVFRNYKGVMINMQQIHERPTAHGLKLNPEKSQVILIRRCRADISPPNLWICDNVVKVVPRVRNFGFVMNGDLQLRIILGRCVRGSIGFCIL
jgi:hypothetical protein